MIYVENTSAAVELRIPRNLSGAPAGVDLDVTGTASRASVGVPVDLVSVGILYYVVRADFSHIEPGEYTYYLSDSDTGETIASGILELGSRQAPPIQYNKNTVYEQYNA